MNHNTASGRLHKSCTLDTRPSSVLTANLKSRASNMETVFSSQKSNSGQLKVSSIEKLVEKVAMTAETYWHFHDYDEAWELVCRIWCVIHRRYFDKRDVLQAILLRHCGFAFTQSRIVPDRMMGGL